MKINTQRCAVVFIQKVEGKNGFFNWALLEMTGAQASDCSRAKLDVNSVARCYPSAGLTSRCSRSLTCNTVQLNSLRVHGRPQQRHVILPADHRSQLAARRIQNSQRRTVAETPHDSFQCGRHQLAVFAQILARGTEEDGGAVERPPRRSMTPVTRCSRLS